jgi:hypothetical protein
MHNPDTALCYIRLSWPRDAKDTESPHRQRPNILRVCEQNGWLPEFCKDAEGRKSGTADVPESFISREYCNHRIQIIVFRKRYIPFAEGNAQKLLPMPTIYSTQAPEFLLMCRRTCGISPVRRQWIDPLALRLYKFP